MTEADERNCRMELEYDGTGLHGWAKQGTLPTVQGLLEQAFRTVLGAVPVLRAAGRTDAGVHARKQVVSLTLPKKVDLQRLKASLNALTPSGIAVVELVPASHGFDARKDAASRTYRYFLCTREVVRPFWSRYCWHVPLKLDLGSMQAAASLAEGKHELAAFTPTETEHVFFARTVHRCRWVRGERGMLFLEIEANAFLRHMVRILVGTMVEVGRGVRDLEDFRKLLERRRREEAGPTAPARGLFLWDVKY